MKSTTLLFILTLTFQGVITAQTLPAKQLYFGSQHDDMLRRIIPISNTEFMAVGRRDAQSPSSRLANMIAVKFDCIHPTNPIFQNSSRRPNLAP